jgi:hypothetical protein
MTTFDKLSVTFVSLLQYCQPSAASVSLVMPMFNTLSTDLTALDNCQTGSDNIGKKTLHNFTFMPKL